MLCSIPNRYAYALCSIKLESKAQTFSRIVADYYTLRGLLWRRWPNECGESETLKVVERSCIADAQKGSKMTVAPSPAESAIEYRREIDLPNARARGVGIAAANSDESCRERLVRATVDFEGKCVPRPCREAIDVSGDR